MAAGRSGMGPESYSDFAGDTTELIDAAIVPGGGEALRLFRAGATSRLRSTATS